MSVPKKRNTSRSKRTRASHFGLKKKTIHVDEEGNPHLPHHAAPASGKYRGRKVEDVNTRKARLARKRKALS